MPSSGHAELFRKRHFADCTILVAVRWYLRFSLSLRDVECLMAERGVSVDHTTVWRWIQRYAPVFEKRLRSKLRCTGRCWHPEYIEIQRYNQRQPWIESAFPDVVSRKRSHKLLKRKSANDLTRR